MFMRAAYPWAKTIHGSPFPGEADVSQLQKPPRPCYQHALGSWANLDSDFPFADLQIPNVEAGRVLR